MNTTLGGCNDAVSKQNTYLSKISSIKDELFTVRSKLGFILGESTEILKETELSKSELDYELTSVLNIVRAINSDLKV